MKEYKIVWAQTAIDDLRAIRTYIEAELLSPETARQIAQSIYESAASLAQMPYRCPADQEVPAYRYLIEGNYYIYFRITESPSAIQITLVRNHLQRRLLSMRG